MYVGTLARRLLSDASRGNRFECIKHFHLTHLYHILHSLPWHVAGRVAGRVAHCDVALDADDAGCVRHCPVLHAVHAELPDWSLTRRPPPVVLTVLADLLGTVNAWETPVIALALSGGNAGERNADAGQGCPCQGPAFEGWQATMPCDQAPASKQHYVSSMTEMDSAQHSTACRYTAYVNGDTVKT